VRRRRGTTGPRETPLGLPTLVTGSIRNPNEDEALAVTMSINATGFALHADDVALGSWGTDEVEIVPLGDRAFEFVAEGDRLIFVPDDLDAFTRRVFPDRGRKRRRRKPSQTTKTAATPKPSKDSPAGEVQPAEGSTEAPRTAPPAKKTKPPRKAKQPKQPRVRRVQVSAADVRRKAKPPKTYELPNDPPSPEPSEGRWLRTIDTARRYGLFSLDRVPVDESLRGSEHRHTYDHRASATSGPGNHICTICGKVRLRRG
jgi:hypothetical protein